MLHVAQVQTTSNTQTCQPWGTVGLSYPTIEGLQNDLGVNIPLLHCLPEDYVKVFTGMIAHDSELVNAGNFIEIISCQVKVYFNCVMHVSGGYKVDAVKLIFMQRAHPSDSPLSWQGVTHSL